MVRNERKYEQAVQFRQRGFTLQEIAKICDVSKGTVSKWLKNKAFSDEITKQNKRRAGQENAKRLKLMQKERGTERAARYQEAVRSAKTEFKHYRNDPLFVAGLMLFSAHGDQGDAAKIRFSTTDRQAHGIFIQFAQSYLGIEKNRIRIWLLLYQGQSEQACMKKWRAKTTLPFSQFHKTQFISKKQHSKPLHHGVGNTIIGSTVLKRKLQTWTELMLRDLSK